MVEVTEIEKGFKQTETGVIPKDWEVVALGSIIDLLTGHPFSSFKYVNEGVRLLRGSNIKRGNTDWSKDITKYWENISSDIKQYELQEGDIVIAMDGSLVGRSFAQLSKKDLPALLLQRVARVRTNGADINFLKHQICNPNFTLYCDTVKTASAIPHISPGDIRGFKIPLPPTRAEQTAIATALSDMDTLIQAQEQLIAKKRAIKQGAMQELLRPKAGWEVKRLGDECDIITKGTTPTSIGKYFQPSGINFIKVESLTSSGKIIKDKVAFIDNDTHLVLKRSQLKEGDVLFSIAGALGRVGIVHKEILPANTNQALAIIRLKNSSEIQLKYLFYYLNSTTIQLYILQISVQGAQTNLSLLNISELLIAYPNKTGQTRIANALSDMDSEIEELEAQLAKYRQVKEGMMQELLTGKKRLV